VTVRAREIRVFVHERKVRRRVVESAFAKTRLAMAGRAILFEDAAMWVVVTARTLRRGRLHLHRRLEMTACTLHPCMKAAQRVQRPGVIDARRLPGCGGMTRGAAGAEPAAMHVAVTVGARRKLDAFVRGVRVATTARDVSVRPNEGERRPAVIELRPRFCELDRGGVALCTLIAERALVRIRVA
jgi:hypothetical protein